MSDYLNADPVETSGATYSQDFSLQTLNILTAGGQRFEMRKLMVELSYYEDIYSFANSGYVTLLDNQGFIESLRLTGNEYIEINFGKIKDGVNSTDQIFRIYKVANRAPTNNLNGEFYTLHFCSEELLLSEQTKISKSYNGQKISDIVRGVLVDKLKVKPNKIQTIEETTGVYNFVVPRMKPFEAISWVSIYARPKSTGTIGADMLFFETKNGYNYRSLQSMFKDPVYATYKYQQTNLPDDVQSFQEKVTSVLNYEFIKSYDSLKDISSGTYANRLISIDPVARQYKVTDFDYSDYFENGKKASLNKNGVLVPLKNRLGKTQNQNYDASLKVVTSNAFEVEAPYIKELPGSVAKNIGIENYVPLRTAQISLANYTLIKIVLPGDPGITAGRTINFNLPTTKPTRDPRELDRFYSGKYLVTAVRHLLQSNGVYQTVLEIAKDSTSVSYGSINNTSSDWNKVVTE